MAYYMHKIVQLHRDLPLQSEASASRTPQKDSNQCQWHRCPRWDRQFQMKIHQNLPRNQQGHQHPQAAMDISPVFYA